MRKIALILFVAILLILSCYQVLRAYSQRPVSQADETKILIGTLKDFPSGTIKPFLQYKLIVFSDPEGLYAISGRCPHMGCMVSFQKFEAKFTCPCHGSVFNKEGSVSHGPAKEDLPWFLIEKDASEQLVVDKSKIVPAGTKYKF